MVKVELKPHRPAADPFVEIGSFTMPMSLWCRRFPVKTAAVRDRLKAGYTGAELIFGKSQPGRRPPTSSVVLRVGSLDLPINRWARLTNQKSSTIERRLKAGADNVTAIFG